MSTEATFRDDHPEDETRAWEILSERVGELVSAWEEGGDPPKLADFLPGEKPGLKRLALAELIKVDLEYRWQHRSLPKQLEEYAAEFPELSRDGLPADLIYEEYHVRKQSGDTVGVDDYFDRFPTQADELRRLMGIEGRTITTALFSGEKADPVEVGDEVDDFDLLARLGKGAFATVFLARQRSMQRLVALKVSANRGSEPQTMAQLDHPHIVRVFDQRLVPERKMRLLYMQYVAGGTLQPVVDLIRQLPASERNGKAFLKVIDGCLERRGESPPAESSTRQRLARANWPEVVCWLGARMAAALDYAHRQGVLHRDVKPANVLVASDGTPKLADFNISCSTKVEGATPAAYFGGSLAYMSPEQLEACNPQNDRRPEELDGKSDVYSLGVLLWELLCGRRPFADEPPKGSWPQTLDAMVVRRREGVQPEAIALMPPDLPPGLKDVLLQSLASDPDDRYESAGELSRQLQLCLRPQVQQLLRPAGSPWRTWVRGHPIFALGIAGVAPNMAMSAVNIQYNKDAIEAFPVLESSEIWNAQLVAVNLLLYSISSAIALGLAWPAIRAVVRLRRGDPADPSLLPDLRRHCLMMGDILFFVAMAAWIASGIIFPTWIWLHEGSKPTNFSALEYFLHFGVSQVLCGLIAATLGFFAVAFVAVRAMYPALVRPDSTDDSDLEALARLSRRVWRYFILSVAAPLLTIGVLALAVYMDPARENNAQGWASAATAGLGLAGFLIAFALARAIQSDLAALAMAVSPSIDPLAEGSQSLESFLSGSR